MPQPDIIVRILLTIVFGAILGLETETREIEKKGKEAAIKDEKSRIGGFRTYSILSLFGGIAGLFYAEGFYPIVYILFLSVILLILAAYILNVQLKKAFGLTTEIAIIITFTIGFLTTSSIVPLEIVLSILILLAFFLSQKRGIGTLIEKFEHKEIIDVIRFSLVALVVLPILPNRNIYLQELFNFLGASQINLDGFKDFVLINPFQTWMVVVIVSGINLLGYFLSKIIGKGRGLFLTGVFSGLISSTSATISLAEKSKHDQNKNNVKLLVGSALISNATSFILILFLLLIGSQKLFAGLFSILILMMIAGFAIGILFIISAKSDKSQKDFEVKYEPFSIGPAIKFVLLILLIKLVIQFMQLMHADPSLLILITALSGFTGIDAPVIALAGLVETSTITLEVGIAAFLLTNAINFLAKVIYGYTLGTYSFARKLLIGLVITAVIGLLGLLIHAY